MRIGIYGGTFNPPHVGHVHAAEEAGRVLNLDKLLIIPDNLPPHKELPEGSPTNTQRLEMAKLAFGSIPCAEISDMELRRDGKSYSVDTVRQVHAQYPDAELWLLIGSDMLKILHLWHEPETILRLAKVGTFSRGDAGEDTMFSEMIPLLRSNFKAEVVRIPIAPMKAASSEFRRVLEKNGSTDLLPAPVLGYIQREHLYGTAADLKRLTPEQLRPIALSYLKHRRMRHVLGTEEEAVRLARRYGADETQARIAALLHDCTKKLNLSEQMALCARYDVALDDMERTTLKLLHAKTGAAVAQHVFGVQAAVSEAIKWHTTGKADMSLLEKVIYLADYIEPSRDFPGVDALRRKVYDNLDAGLAMGLEMTIEEMHELGEPVHPKTLEALQFLKG